MTNSIAFKLLTIFLNFIFFKILTENLSTDLFGRIMYFFSISVSISILSNLGSDTIVSKKRLKGIKEDIFEGNISYNEFHSISLIVAFLSSPFIALAYGVTEIINILIIMISSLSLTHAKIFSSNFLSSKIFFWYYYFSIFGFLFCIVISSFIFNDLIQIFLFSSLIFNLSIYIINIKYNFIEKLIFLNLYKINFNKIIFTLKKSLPFVIILFLASSHEIISQYWLSQNFNFKLSGYVVLLYRIASLVVLGLAALNLFAYFSFNNLDKEKLHNNFFKEYFSILKISVSLSILVIIGIYFFHRLILLWFNLPINNEIMISLSILVLGQFLVICLGPISMAMTQFGEQRIFATIYIFCCLLNIFLLFIFEVITSFIIINPLIYASIAYCLCFILIHLIAFCFFFYTGKFKIKF